LSNNNDTFVIRGVANWAKVLGPPRLNTFTDEKEWSIDVTPDKDSRALLRKLGINDRLRDPKDGDTREDSFMSFRQREFRKDGTKNDPIRIVDATNQKWGNSLIGNGSTVDVRFAVKDYGKGKKKGVYIRAIRVLEHVPYESEDFAPLDSDDEYFAEAGNSNYKLPEGLEPQVDDDYDLDDDVPE